MNDKKIIERILEERIEVFEYKNHHSPNIRKNFSNRKDCIRFIEIVTELLTNKLNELKDSEE